jgi:hypothetical protein
VHFATAACPGCWPAASALCSAAARKTAAIGHGPAAAVITSTALFREAMAAPAVAIAPAGPGTHAQKDTAVKVSWPIESVWRAGVGRVVVIAVGADRLNADVNDNLRVRGCCKSQSRNECGSAEKCFESSHG